MAEPGTTDTALFSRGAVTVAGAREEYAIPRSSLYLLISRGELRTVRAGRRRLIPRVEIERYLARNLAPAR